MKALTLRHPWAWAICCAGKRIENRTWSPPLRVGEKFAIHGGKFPLGADDKPHGAKETEYVEDITETVRELSEQKLLPGGLISLRMLSGYVGIVAVATFGGTVTESSSPWFCGPIGWALSDVLALPRPVPCKGAQGLWTVPEDVLSAMRVQFEQQDHGQPMEDDNGG